MDALEQRRPALRRPPLVIRVQAPPAVTPWAHAAVIARLYDDQFAPAQPCDRSHSRTCALGRQHVQSRADHSSAAPAPGSPLPCSAAGVRVPWRSSRSTRCSWPGACRIAQEDAPTRVDAAPPEHAADTGQLPEVTLTYIDGPGMAVAQRAPQLRPAVLEQERQMAVERPHAARHPHCPRRSPQSRTRCPPPDRRPEALVQQVQQRCHHDHVAEATEEEYGWSEWLGAGCSMKFHSARAARGSRCDFSRRGVRNDNRMTRKQGMEPLAEDAKMPDTP